MPHGTHDPQHHPHIQLMWFWQEEHKSNHMSTWRCCQSVLPGGNMVDPPLLYIFCSLCHHLLPWSPCSRLVAYCGGQNSWRSQQPWSDGEKDPSPRHTTAYLYQMCLCFPTENLVAQTTHSAQGQEARVCPPLDLIGRTHVPWRGLCSLQCWLQLIHRAPCPTEG